MRVYFVRHGQTELNVRHIHQPLDTGLSSVGTVQSEMVANALKSENIDTIFSSDLPRAVATAEKISAVTNVPIERTHTLREIRRPNSLYGISHFHFKTIRYVFSTIWNHDKIGWHYQDGESIYELHQRARSVVDKLESISTLHSNVVVVSHAVFLEILIAFICREQNLKTIDYFPIFSPFSKIKNSAITTLEFLERENGNVCAWLPILYNDTTHLAV